MRKHDITEFIWGETVSITMLAREPDGVTPLAAADSATLTLSIEKLDGSEALTISTEESNLNLSDVAAARFQLVLPPASYQSALKANGSFRYTLTSRGADGSIMVQNYGAWVMSDG